jgi:hypothetical protein
MQDEVSWQKKLILIVERNDDVDPVPPLVKKLVTDAQGRNCLHLESRAIRVGGLEKLSDHHRDNWLKTIQLAGVRPTWRGCLFFRMTIRKTSRE